MTINIICSTKYESHILNLKVVLDERDVFTPVSHVKYTYILKKETKVNIC